MSLIIFSFYLIFYPYDEPRFCANTLQSVLPSGNELIQSYALPSATTVEHLTSTFNETKEYKPEASPSISLEI